MSNPIADMMEALAGLPRKNPTVKVSAVFLQSLAAEGIEDPEGYVRMVLDPKHPGHMAYWDNYPVDSSVRPGVGGSEPQTEKIRELYEWAHATATVPTSVIDTMHGLWPWLMEETPDE